MNWNKLTSNKCPKCNTLLKETDTGHDCTNCDFFITKARFNEVIEDMYTEQRRHMDEPGY